MEKPKKLQFRIDVVLTVFFLVLIFGMGAMTLVTDHEGIYKSATRMTLLSNYLPEDYDAWDLLEARVKSVDGYLSQNVYQSTNLGYLNSSMQYALGKRIISTGSSNMLTLNTGHLYDLQSDMSMAKAAEDIDAMRDTVPEGTPFLFVYDHPTIYSDDMLPEGYDVLDHSAKLAEDILSRLDAENIDYLDSRKVLTATGLPISDYLLVTDQHWATRAGLIMAQAVADKINQLLPVNLDSSRLEIDQFESETYEKLFLGKYGQRIGTLNVTPDDITVYWPKYSTNLTRSTCNLGKLTTQTGDFKSSVIRWDCLKPDAGKTWNTVAYRDYGLIEDYDIFTNPDAADCTILLLKDSYATSIGAFLSLVADEVVAVDLRRDVGTLQAWIEKYDPDIVITAYSMQMLRDENYAFQ